MALERCSVYFFFDGWCQLGSRDFGEAPLAHILSSAAFRPLLVSSIRHGGPNKERPTAYFFVLLLLSPRRAFAVCILQSSRSFASKKKDFPNVVPLYLYDPTSPLPPRSISDVSVPTLWPAPPYVLLPLLFPLLFSAAHYSLPCPPLPSVCT